MIAGADIQNDLNITSGDLEIVLCHRNKLHNLKLLSGAGGQPAGLVMYLLLAKEAQI
jgi:hypothetical protein